MLSEIMSNDSFSTNSCRSSDAMDSDVSEDLDTWKDQLQSYRMHLVEKVQYRTLYPALLSYMVIDSEDHEELSNPYALRTEKMRLNHLVDILSRKGEANYKKFLDILSSYYPVVYKEITGKEPEDIVQYQKRLNSLRLVSIVAVASQVEGIGASKVDESTVQLLTQALDNLAQEKIELARKLKRLGRCLEDKNSECDLLRQSKEDLQLRVELYNTVDNELSALRQEADRLKTENYTVCMLMIDVKNENGDLREANIKLKNEIDKITMEKQKLENCVRLERSQSVRLRNKLQHSLSVHEVMEMKKEIDELRLKLAQANSENSFSSEDIDMRIQILQRDKDEAIEMYAEAVQNLNKLREDNANAESLRDKYLEEKEQLELTVTVLQSDCEMFKHRRDTMWQQLQEVEKEREMLMKERNDAQQLAKACMEEKTQYRLQIRQHQEQYDKLAKQFLEAKQEILSLKSRYRKSSDVTVIPQKDLYSTLNASGAGASSATSTLNRSTASSSETDDSGRPRTHNIKHYAEFSRRSLSDPLKRDPPPDDDNNGLKNVFPEIELAADYGPRDSETESLSSPREEVPSGVSNNRFSREKHKGRHYNRLAAYPNAPRARSRSSGAVSTSPSPPAANSC